MKRIVAITAIVITVGFALTGCYYDKEELVYPIGNTPVNCDTANLTYTTGIEPIFNNRCYSCHNGSSPSGNLNLSLYNQAKNRGPLIVTRITIPVGQSGHMPDNGLMLPECEIAKIRAWVNNGAPQ